MARIQNLPGAGSSFRVSTGAGNFTKKFKKATLFGELKNLKDNEKAILKVIKKNETAIRRGGFNRLRQLNAWKMVKQEEGSKLTKDDRKEIKQLFKHLGEGKKSDNDELKSEVTMDKSLDKDMDFVAARHLAYKNRILNRASYLNNQPDSGENGLSSPRSNLNSQPQDPANHDHNALRNNLLKRRFQSKEEQLKSRLPSNRVSWEEERGKRLEVSSLTKKVDKDENKNDALRNSGNQAFRNL